MGSMNKVFLALGFLLLAPLAQADGAQQAKQVTPAVIPTLSCALPSRVAQGEFAKRPLHPTHVQTKVSGLAASYFTQSAYEALPLDGTMSQRIFTSYLKALDPDHVFFTAGDIASFQPVISRLPNDIWSGQLQDPFAMFTVYEKRVKERIAYAKGLVKQGAFNFKLKESLDVDRSKTLWAANVTVLDQLWRKRVKNDWLRLKLAGKNVKDIQKVLDTRYNNYLNTTREIDSEDVFSTFMNAYARSNDPHSNYFGPRASENFNIAMKLSLDGIGAELQRRDEYTIIRRIIPGSPASRSTLRAGDRITAVAQGQSCKWVDVVGWRIDDVVALIRGKKNTIVRLQVLPADAGVAAKHESITIIRKKITIEDQAAKKKLISIYEHGHLIRIGVIDLPAFYENFAARGRGDPNYRSATRDVAKLLTELKEEKVDGIIIDLRNNGGGSLSEAIELSGLFIGKGPVVQVRNNRGQIEVENSDETRVWNGPMAVMVNRSSASASEIFTAAMQDYGRALIIGHNTYGKGTVQTLINLNRLASPPSGKYGELKMTIAEFFRVDGGSTQLRGVQPDIIFPETINPKDFGESSNSYALPWSHIPPAHYTKVANLTSLLPILRHEHEQHIAHNPSWQLMLKELASVRKLQSETSISLNYTIRDQERKAFEKRQTAFKAEEKKIKAATARLNDKQSTVSKVKIRQNNHHKADDGLLPAERSVSENLAQQRRQDQRPDEMLQEAAYILTNEIELLRKNPKLAAAALPPGGIKTLTD